MSNYLYEKREAVGLFGKRVLLDDSFLQLTKLCVIQYVVVRLVLSIIAFILQVAAPTTYQLYNIQASNGYIYLQVIHVVSQILILYQLASFVRFVSSCLALHRRVCKLILQSYSPAYLSNQHLTLVCCFLLLFLSSLLSCSACETARNCGVGFHFDSTRGQICMFHHNCVCHPLAIDYDWGPRAVWQYPCQHHHVVRVHSDQCRIQFAQLDVMPRVPPSCRGAIPVLAARRTIPRQQRWYRGSCGQGSGAIGANGRKFSTQPVHCWRKCDQDTRITAEIRPTGPHQPQPKV